MKTLNKYIGLDVHKDTTVMAIAEGQRMGVSKWESNQRMNQRMDQTSEWGQAL